MDNKTKASQVKLLLQIYSWQKLLRTSLEYNHNRTCVLVYSIVSSDCLCTAGGHAMNSKSPQKSPPKKHAKTSNKVFPGRAQAYLEETDAETDQSVKNSPG
jgi:hypothetical protein